MRDSRLFRLVRYVAQEPDADARAELERERAQSLVRLVNSVIVLAYLLASLYPADFHAGLPMWFLVLAGFVVLSVVVFVRTRHEVRSSLLRRFGMLVADIGIVTYGMIATGEVGIPLFILYLSIVLGNGLRFGRRAMVTSTVLALAGFTLVLAQSPVWRSLPALATAVVVLLVLLPMSMRWLRDAAGRREHASVAPRETQPDAVRPSRLHRFAPRLSPKRVDELGREQGQAFVRLVNSIFVLGYFALARSLDVFEADYLHWILGTAFVAFSMLLLVLTRRAAKTSLLRRMLGNIADVAAISYGMVITGTFGIPLFILYLSTTLGNGFRFGLQALVTSATLSLIGFGTVVTLSPVWQALPASVPVAVALALVLLPAYTAHLIHRLAEATKRAEEASAAKSRFLARMSHELRTPLNGILGTAELLGSSKRLSRDERSLLDIIRDSVRVSMRQIDNVLDFSKIEAGKLVIEQVEFDIHAVLNRAVRLVRASALEKNLRLMLRVDPAIPHRLIGDPHHLDEVCLNLLSNAVKFTEKGYVSLEARLLQEGPESAQVRLEVYDTGIGIEPAALARIFEAFVQEDGSTTRRYGGTGLGTTIAKQLVELMGGELRVESIKGKGSRFYADIRFPRPGLAEGETAGTEIAGLRLLLLSRDAGLAEQLRAIVAEWGVILLTANTAAEALGLLARGIRLGNPIGVVLADSRCVLGDDGRHTAADFVEKAWISATPAFLICDVCPDDAQLRTWGYAAIVPFAVHAQTLYNLLRACGATDVAADQGIVQVEPWVWRQRGAHTRPRLLVADDNRTNLMILERILGGAGYQVDTVTNGEEALEKLLHGRYKVAVIDMHMPGLDGVDVIKQYRMMQTGAKTPIVMLTANATMNAKLESAEAGADAYLTKPATSATVLSTIRKLLEDREIHEIKQNHSTEQDRSANPILDADVVSELARLYEAPEDLARLLDTFEAEGGRLFHELQASVEKRNHEAFRELVHALKGNGANVGASRLAQLCLEIESVSLLDFYRNGKRLVARLHETFVASVRALREETAPNRVEPASGLDAK